MLGSKPLVQRSTLHGVCAWDPAGTRSCTTSSAFRASAAGCQGLGRRWLQPPVALGVWEGPVRLTRPAEPPPAAPTPWELVGPPPTCPVDQPVGPAFHLSSKFSLPPPAGSAATCSPQPSSGSSLLRVPARAWARQPATPEAWGRDLVLVDGGDKERF